MKPDPAGSAIAVFAASYLDILELGSESVIMSPSMYIKDQKRKVVVETMARKLAGPEPVSTVLYAGKVKKRRHLLFSACFIGGFVFILTVVLIVTFLTRREQRRIADQLTSGTSAELLTEAYEKGTITPESYAQYLVYLLVKYDSLPAQFKTVPPRISDIDVYRKLKPIWPGLPPADQQKLLSAMPLLQSRMDQVRAVEKKYAAPGGTVR